MTKITVRREVLHQIARGRSVNAVSSGMFQRARRRSFLPGNWRMRPRYGARWLRSWSLNDAALLFSKNGTTSNGAESALITEGKGEHEGLLLDA